MTNLKGQVGQMKVKTAELKANLSRYVRQVRESGEPIEILLREETVAYLTPACGRDLQTTNEIMEKKALEHAFEEIGLTCQLRRGVVKTPLAAPAVSGDGRTDIDSVDAMRAEKDW